MPRKKNDHKKVTHYTHEDVSEEDVQIIAKWLGVLGKS